MICLLHSLNGMGVATLPEGLSATNGESERPTIELITSVTFMSNHSMHKLGE